MEKIKIKPTLKGVYGRQPFTADAIVLAKFKVECPEYIFRGKEYKVVTKQLLHYLVFIPWKHQEKELLAIEENEIIDGNLVIPAEWIRVDKFTSPTRDEIPDCFEIRDFWGYDFIYENDFFIAHCLEHRDREPLEVLYKNMPELLLEEIDG